jgi:hypothetical protein
LPHAPSTSKRKVADVQFRAFTAVATSANLADAITTAKMVGHGTYNCRYEAGTAFLYGQKANDARVYAVVTGETVGAALAAYYLKKYRVRIGRFKLWALPLTVSALGHGVGAANNMRRCR